MPFYIWTNKNFIFKFFIIIFWIGTELNWAIFTRLKIKGIKKFRVKSLFISFPSLLMTSIMFTKYLCIVFFSYFSTNWWHVINDDDDDSHSVMSNSFWLMDYTCQAPLSMEVSRQEYWSGLPFTSPNKKLIQPANLLF